jgi:hypothetical protein
MPTVVLHHDISKDTDHWLSSPKREQVLGPLGARNIRTFVAPQNRHHVALLMEVDDIAQLNAAIASPSRELAEAMEHDGVEGQTLAVLVEE